MATDLVSIIMAAYNAESWIRESIQSVLDQSYRNWELLVINDGSTDKTTQIIKSFKDPRVRYFETEHGGVSAARNTGLENMKGDFFCFLDADDLLPENSIGSRVIKMRNEPSLEFVDGQVGLMHSDTRSLYDTWKPSLEGTPFRSLLKLDGKCFLGSTWMFRHFNSRDYCFEESLTHGEDLLFCIDQSLKGGLYSWVNEPAYIYRKRLDSTMNDLDGLGDGYRQILIKLRHAGISEDLLAEFKSRARSIMIKSYLSKGRVYSALKTMIIN